MVTIIILLTLSSLLTQSVDTLPESNKLSTVKKSSSKYVHGRSSGNFDNCLSKGNLYPHGSNLTRSDDPCERCFCYKGTILCWNINCPTSVDRQGCKEITIKDLCCPILECPLDAKDVMVNEITKRQPRASSISSTSSTSTASPAPIPSSSPSESIAKEIGCKYGGEKYKIGQRISINPLKPCQRCTCNNEGRIKCELLSACKDDKSLLLKKNSPMIKVNKESTDETINSYNSNVSSFSTRTIPDAILKRVQNLLHKVSVHNLTEVSSINSND